MTQSNPQNLTVELERYLNAQLSALGRIESAADLEQIRVAIFGRRGSLAKYFDDLSKMTGEERKAAGQKLNQVKSRLQQAFDLRQGALSGGGSSKIDPNLPGEHVERGHLHPITQYSRKMIEVWRSLGYDVHEGPELEDQWYNFEGLNMPADHPARDIQDTFYIKGHENLVMRTHCSTVQLRSVIHKKPPFKYVEIGRSYRHEATDATHEAMFSHCDGIVIDRHLTMVHLVTTLKAFLSRMFPQTPIRIRPGYFPFVEPGIEVDMEWERNGKKEWLEMLGAGMVHPNVLKAMGLKPGEWTGFAFGMGVERQVMINSGVPDIRKFYSGDLEFLKQF